VLAVTSGDPRLATAGTGDVLTGVVAAFLAAGLPGPEAAAAAAHVHGRAGALAWPRGLVASDLVALLPVALSELQDA
jgi:NAD(P)H-hydrate repair Nnr-like enzyme with NAD(P)H-hydrate dehydratase domain